MEQLIYLVLLIVCAVAVLKRFNKRSSGTDDPDQE